MNKKNFVILIILGFVSFTVLGSIVQAKIINGPLFRELRENLQESNNKIEELQNTIVILENNVQSSKDSSSIDQIQLLTTLQNLRKELGNLSNENIKLQNKVNYKSDSDYYTIISPGFY